MGEVVRMVSEKTDEYTVIEKTGHNDETQQFFEGLNEFKVMQLIKGESSFWINSLMIMPYQFEFIYIRNSYLLVFLV
jgi:hypothetical protein